MISSTRLPRQIKYVAERFLMPATIPKNISERFRTADSAGMDVIEASLRRSYFSPKDAWYDERYLSSDEGSNDLQDHLCRRLDNFRKTVVPWLSDARPLTGANILELGCGTGSLTVALAEQGARVTAIDIAQTSLTVGMDRCEVYGLDVDFIRANATEVHEILSGRPFDFVIFSATLEHMTHDERMIAMSNTWNMLSKGDLWCIVETPNRLWFYDGHTSLMPFYSWLPDDLAFLYSRFSPRRGFCDLYRETTEGSRLDFLRRGRGVSFHEFELAMKRAADLDVASSRAIFLRSRSVLRRALWKLTIESRYESFLVKAGPKIHRGFYQPFLDLIIVKD